MHRLRKQTLFGALAALAVVAAVAACGDDSDPTSGNGVDRAFAAQMVGHHELAIQMAQVARERTTRPAVKALADDIVRAQRAEIKQLHGIDRELAARGVEPASLGLSSSMMGMNMDDAMLMDAKPFDRMFIDMMVPHHQGAIRMARVQLAKGSDARLKRIATAVVAAQPREIGQMNAWRQDWYGGPSPAGGVPAQTDSMSDAMEMPGHGM